MPTPCEQKDRINDMADHVAEIRNDVKTLLIHKAYTIGIFTAVSMVVSIMITFLARLI